MNDQKIDQPTLQYYLLLFWKKKYLIVFSSFLTSFLVLIVSFLLPPIYKSTSTVLVEDKTDKLSLFLPPPTQTMRSEVFTQAELMKSRILLEKAVTKLKLAENYDSTKELTYKVKKFIYGLWGKKVSPFSKEEIYQSVVKNLQNKIKVIVLEGTNLISLATFSENPKIAFFINHIILSEFIKLNYSFKGRETKNIYQLTESELDIAKNKLSFYEKQLKDFKEKTGIVELGEETRGRIDALSRLEEQYANIMGEKKGFQSEVINVRKNIIKQNKDLANSILMSDHPEVLSLKKELVNLEIERTNFLSQEFQNQDKLLRIDKDIEEKKEELKRTIINIIKDGASTIIPYLPDKAIANYQELASRLITLETEINSLQAKEDALLRVINYHKNRLNELPSIYLKLAQLQRDVTAQERTVLMLMEKNEQVRIAKSMKFSNIRIIDPPIISYTPVKPQKTVNAIMGLFGGLILAIAITLLQEYLVTFKKSILEDEKNLKFNL